MPNRLAFEKSPYLLQHASNPVDWFPWGDEAFGLAQREQKPIFLSIGYSTCHWCHVMARESFENAAIAELLNRHYVSIKVDREERPDVDRVYMNYVQATTGSGGWPLSVWLTPDLHPFYGGMYFPPTSRWGRPGFADLLHEIARIWRDEREAVVRAATDLARHLVGDSREAPSATLPGAGALAAAVDAYARAFDARSGGFGGAPKFPRPSELLFLFREFARTGNAQARDMALTTARAIVRGGLRDQIGGGFHRYSVDAEWRIPHFEKMLYDQAQLVLAAVDAFQTTRDREFAGAVEDTLEYVQRDLTSPAGAFYSAEDADSLPAGTVTPAEKREGAFYLWDDREIGTLLGDAAGLVRLRFGLRPEGNVPADPRGEFHGLNHLFEAHSVAEVAAQSGLPVDAVEGALARARATLFAARARRPRPHLDDKVLTAWNGLMIAAYARAGRVLSRRNYTQAARRAAAFIERTLWGPDAGRLLRRFRGGEAAIDAFAEDYACLIFGLLELVQADGDPHWLQWALALQRQQDTLFWDEQRGGWFSTTGTDPSILVRSKEDYDGAEPSATSVSVGNLLILAHLTGDADMRDKVDRTLQWLAPHITGMPRAVPMLLAALSLAVAGLRQVVIVGPPDREDTRRLHAALASRYLPAVVCVPLDPARKAEFAALLPFVAGMEPVGGRATAYVCREFTCQSPTSDSEEMLAFLTAPR